MLEIWLFKNLNRNKVIMINKMFKNILMMIVWLNFLLVKILKDKLELLNLSEIKL